MQLTPEQAKKFCTQWLPAWGGNRPEKLAAFYSEHAFYSDPGLPEGIRGRPALLAYFKKLLAYNPNWVWENVEAIPMEDGFLNKWRARIPVGAKIIECVGVCLVQFDDQGLIRRNETYYDRTAVLKEIERVSKKTLR